jgi:hypothetical protein
MSATAPWFKFYPRDWRGDQALRMVSISARGLWMECLCIMHEARPYGHLLVNGRPVGDDALARMTGASVDEVRSLMDELQQAGVLSVTGEGVIFSRRMVRDQERSAKGRKAVNERRWHKTENIEEKPPPNRLPNTKPITQRPEARGQKEKEPNGSRHPDSLLAGEIQQAFDLWNATAETHGLPRAEKLTPKRRSRLKARLRDSGLDGWSAALARLSRSSFCLGRKTDFRADLDFVLQEQSFQRLVEGFYDDPGSRDPPSLQADADAIDRQREALKARVYGEA